MGKARKEVVSQEESGVYHVWNRCAREAFLLGGKFEHRKKWILDRIYYLGEVFEMDVFTQSILDNHYHLVIQTHPELVKDWSELKVATKWFTLCPPEKYVETGDVAILHAEILRLASCPKEVEEKRARLASLSWYMKLLNEFIARKANKEVGIHGCFWSGRFGCTRLLDEESILTCMAYVDLNPVRAKIAKLPEADIYTGAFKRAEKLKKEELAKNSSPTPSAPPPPKTKKSKRKSKRNKKKRQVKVAVSLSKQPEEVKDTQKSLSPLPFNHKHFPLSITEAEYLEFLDWSGRQLRKPGQGVIPEDCPPILLRLGIEEQHWSTTIDSYEKKVRRVFGKVEKMRDFATTQNKKWFVGLGFSQFAFKNQN